MDSCHFHFVEHRGLPLTAPSHSYMQAFNGRSRCRIDLNRPKQFSAAVWGIGVIRAYLPLLLAQEVARACCGDSNIENAAGTRAVIEPLVWRCHTSCRPS